MKRFALTVFLSFTVISSCIGSSVDISEPNGDVCLGAAATFTCTVNGTVLGWRYGGVSGATALYAAMGGITSSSPLGSTPFSTRITDVSDGIITSIATASNLTRDANGMTLECSNGLFNSNTTEKANVTLPLQVPSKPNSSDATFENSTCIKLTWIGSAACVQSYSIVVNNTFKDIVNELMYFYCPQSSGDYIFQIASISYFGERVPGSDNAVYHWQKPESIYFITDSNSSGLFFTIKDDDDSNRPPITSCSVTLNGEARSCDIDEPVFFDISFGSYTYNVTVINNVGLVYRTGSLFFMRPNDTSPTHTGTSGFSVSPIEFASPFIALGVLIILLLCWILLRICWERQCCCPRIWRSSFWLIFFCYDCCTYNAGVKERIDLKNPNIGGDEKGNNTSF